ncbi:rhodanese-like domain-containing protein [Proteinivorax tanatarense]|uniref:Rhodanese-like domain-containing protein n=1 Tax=Proteinivorax tanatarense TaxID=1260629 RepID=A0AAU7VM49_9FIRM
MESKGKERNRIFFKTVLILLIPSVLLIIFGILLLPSDLGGQYIEITGEEAEIIVETNEVQIIDLRPQHQYEKTHIPQSINLSEEVVTERYHSLDKREITIVIPHTGNDGEEIARFLVDQGFADVYILKAGIEDWPGDLEKN